MSVFRCEMCESFRDADVSGEQVCADCKRSGCDDCTGFAELPGYPLCESCRLARDEKDHAEQERHALGTAESPRETEK